MKRILIFGVFFLFLVGGVSAFWPFDSPLFSPPGVNENFPNSDICKDSDLGTFVDIGGVVHVKASRGEGKDSPDICVGTTKVKEYYCSGNSAKPQVYECPGECEIVSDPASEEFGFARCVVIESSCTEIVLDGEVIGVKDQYGVSFMNSCGVGEERGKSRVYSCEENNVISELIDCPRCKTEGKGEEKHAVCFGFCKETDSENDKDVPGIVDIDGVEYPDEVRGEKDGGVKQYACKDGMLKSLETQLCGPDRVARDSPKGAYCQDKYSSYGSITNVEFDCAYAIRNAGKEPIIISGDAKAVESIGIGGGFDEKWGIGCVDDYKKTGCYLANPAGLADSDIVSTSNGKGCLTDDEEYNASAGLSIVCCKVTFS